jgi:hypothetical protein
MSLLHSDIRGINQARRNISYDRLVLLAPLKGSEALETGIDTILRQEENATDIQSHKPELIRLDPHNIRETFGAIEDLLSKYRKDDLTVNLGGEVATITHAALLACLRHGLAARFYLHDHEAKLPVLEHVRIEETFPPDDADFMLRLHDNPNLAQAAEGLSPSERDKRFQRLRRRGVIRAASEGGKIRAVFTPEGLGYLTQLLELKAKPNANDSVTLFRPFDWGEEDFNGRLRNRPQRKSIKPGRPK